MLGQGLTPSSGSRKGASTLSWLYERYWRGCGISNLKLESGEKSEQRILVVARHGKPNAKKRLSELPNSREVQVTCVKESDDSGHSIKDFWFEVVELLRTSGQMCQADFESRWMHSILIGKKKLCTTINSHFG